MGNISLLDLCGCETWFVMLREEHRLKGVWEYVGPKRDERIWDRRKLRNEEVHDVYCLLTESVLVITSMV